MLLTLIAVEPMIWPSSEPRGRCVVDRLLDPAREALARLNEPDLLVAAARSPFLPVEKMARPSNTGYRSTFVGDHPPNA
jgi:hypothetical protein